MRGKHVNDYAPPPNKKKFVAIVFGFLVIIGGCLKAASDNTNNRYASSGSGSGSSVSEPSSDQVFAIAETYLKSTLKAPSTADIPPSGNVQDLGDNTFRVLSYVDAQNSFGAKLRSNWYCELKYKGGAWDNFDNWTLIDVRLIEQ